MNKKHQRYGSRRREVRDRLLDYWLLLVHKILKNYFSLMKFKGEK